MTSSKRLRKIVAVTVAVTAAGCVTGEGCWARPSRADCLDLREMGAALSPMCQWLIDHPNYDQDLSSGGGYTPPGGGGEGDGGGTPGDE
jgi:hypothetical protein